MPAAGWTAPRPQESEHDFSIGKALAGDPRSVITACGVRAPKWSNPGGQSYVKAATLGCGAQREV